MARKGSEEYGDLIMKCEVYEDELVPSNAECKSDAATVSSPVDVEADEIKFEPAENVQSVGDLPNVDCSSELLETSSHIVVKVEEINCEPSEDAPAAGDGVRPRESSPRPRKETLNSSSMDTSRKRVSIRQTELLVEYLESHRTLARGRQLKSKEGIALATRLWTECANILNAEADGDQRTPRQWNKWFNDFKCRLLGKIKHIRNNQSGKSGEPDILAHGLSPLEERLAVLFEAPTQVVEWPGIPQNEVQKTPSTTVTPVSAVRVFSRPVLPEPDPLVRGDGEHIQDTEYTMFDGVEDVAEVVLSEGSGGSEQIQEAAAATARKRIPRRRRHLNGQPVQPQSELEASKNFLTRIEKSRIDVERMMAAACNKMADAMNKMADASNKSAEAQSRMAEAIEKLSDGFRNRNLKRRRNSSDEDCIIY